ncbi:hypothetical protein V6N12_015477 [Hibiscus sabdariffa]|uniref:Uncharacterized protein n=1 Tax=Hibiscus sabdariffa TaxID=183260 RepID=A0ABR2DR77_9ROSI
MRVALTLKLYLQNVILKSDNENLIKRLNFGVQSFLVKSVIVMDILEVFKCFAKLTCASYSCFYLTGNENGKASLVISAMVRWASLARPFCSRPVGNDVIGIDSVTTNSCVSVMDGTNARVIENAERARTSLSVKKKRGANRWNNMGFGHGGRKGTR